MIDNAIITSSERQHDAMDRLECEIAKLPVPETKLVHHFAEGIYARELHLPKGCLLTGKIHKTRHLNILSKGKILVTAVGEESRVLEAPACFVAEPGARRAGYAIEDSVWTTVHHTHETDLDKLEAELIEPHVNPMLDYETRRLKQ